MTGAYGPLTEIHGPRTGQITTMTYDSTWTHISQTTNSYGHVTTTEYDPGTGNLKKLVPPLPPGNSVLDPD